MTEMLCFERISLGHELNLDVARDGDWFWYVQMKVFTRLGRFCRLDDLSHFTKDKRGKVGTSVGLLV